MPDAVIPLQSGQTVSADDWGTARPEVINWLVDSSGSFRPRPAIVNTQFDPGSYGATSGTNEGLIGLYVWTSVFDRREYLVYVRQDRTIWAKDLITFTVTALSDATIGTQLEGSADLAIFTEDTQRLIIAGGGQLQIWDGNTANLSARIAVTVPGTNEPPLSATHAVSVANYIIANQSALASTNNRIFWSNLGDSNHVVWNPLNFNTADADPDAIVALGANLREVFAFGAKTIQVFGIGADPTLPFTASRSMALGCSAPYSVIRRDNDFAMLDDSRRFVTTDGNSFSEIGEPIAKLIRDRSMTVSDCRGFRYQDDYWDLLVWIFPTSERGWAYDQRQKAWYQVRGWNGADDYAGIRINCYAFWGAGNLHLVGDPLYENIWTLDPNTYTDQGPGLTLLAEKSTERLDHGFPGRKRCDFVRFYVKRGQGTSTPPLLGVSKRDDDGPWSQETMLDLGIAGDYVSFKDWRPGGIYRRRQYRVRYSSGVDMSITRAVETWEAYGG